MRERQAPWVVVAGRAVAPFLSAGGADLSLAVAGALILSPAPWSPGKALDLSPLAFPVVLLADPEEVPRGQDLAQAWGARLLSARIAGPILSDPSVVDIITRRALSLSRAEAAAPSRAGAPIPANSASVLRPRTPAIASRTSSIAVRRDVPILQERVNGKQLVWFDNAATTQKLQQVIERLSHFYGHENFNIHCAAHELAARATDACEGARKRGRGFLGAASTEEIIFTRGTTESINLVANTLGSGEHRRWGKEHRLSP